MSTPTAAERYHDAPRPRAFNPQDSSSTIKTGKDLYRWAKDSDAWAESEGLELRDGGYLKFLTGFGRYERYPSKMLDWNEKHVTVALNAVRRWSTSGKATQEA